MTDLKDQAQRDIDRALNDVRVLIARAVRAEQLVDQLTGLGNDAALVEWIQSRIDKGDEFWLAFIEVDKFKSVNDLFGYDPADDLLRRIAVQLKNGAQHFFGEPAAPFRAHGDEFFVGGAGRAEGVDEALDRLRSTVSAIRVVVPGKPSKMWCTVSTGWATSADAQATKEGLTVRSLRGILETAVAHAKRSRDCVVRYVPELEHVTTREGRADCGGCGGKFTLHVPVGDERDTHLHCPNCGEQVERPPSLRALVAAD